MAAVAPELFNNNSDGAWVFKGIILLMTSLWSSGAAGRFAHAHLTLTSA